MDRGPARGDRPPDDGGVSEPELRRAAGPRAADAGGLRADHDPEHAHCQGPPAAGRLPPAGGGLLPHRGPQAERQQAERPEALPPGDGLPHLRPLCTPPLHLLQNHQEHVAATPCANFTLHSLELARWPLQLLCPQRRCG